jgi:hypothetical protein
MRALEFFARYGEIDLYGKGWDVPPYVVGETWIPATVTKIHRYVRKRLHPWIPMHPWGPVIDKAYRGVAASKYVTQSQYTFTICYENMILPGWLNENILDCFLVGTIPIYLGAPDVTDLIPERCFIDKRRFPTYPELRSYLKGMTEKDIRTYRENARDFVEGGGLMPFNKHTFVDHFTKAVEEDLGIRLRDAG